MKKVRVLIVDDHTLMREGIRALLARAANAANIEVVGEAANGKEALEKVGELAPDVVLMDLAMPVMNGIEATQRISKKFPMVKVLALTQYNDSEYIIPIVEAGALGFITKMSASSELTSAIQAAYRGKSFLSPSAATAVVQQCQQKLAQADPYQQITDREREVLKLVAEGRTTREIADAMFISIKTVEWHRANLMNKLNIHNRTELIKFAIRKQIIDLH